MNSRILVINAGSTSVKLALYTNGSLAASAEAPFRRREMTEDLAAVAASLPPFLREAGVSPRDLSAVAARGGLLKPMVGGTYLVDEAMVADLRHARYGEHASNYSVIVAADVAREAGICAYIVDPVTVDELGEEVRVTGIPEIRRRCIFHALNQKAVARRACQELGKPYAEARLIVAHMGGGITVGAHLRGRVVDVTNALDGEGPITPERAGAIPAAELAKLCFSGRYTAADVKRMLTGHGGMIAHLATSDMKEVERRMQAGDAQAMLLARAMAYTIAREIAARTAALGGPPDAIVLTGGMARWGWLVDEIRARVGFLAPFMLYPETMEMEALALGVLRVLRGEEEARRY